MLTFHSISGENNHNVSLIEQPDSSTVAAELFAVGVTLRSLTELMKNWFKKGTVF